MNPTDDELKRLFDRAFTDEAPGDGLWDATRTAMRRKVRMRQTMVAASVAVVVALAVAVPQMLLSQRTGPDLEFFEAPPPAEEREGEPEVSHTEKPLHLTPTPSDDADSSVAPAPPPPPTLQPPRSDEPAETGPPPPQAGPSGLEAPPEAPVQERTDWYTVHLHEEIEPGARHYSARQAMDALVANMRFADGARVSHGLRGTQESSATGWVEVTGVADDTVSGEETLVQLRRDDQGWFAEPVAQARSTCRRGVDQTDRSRCV